MIAWLWLCLSPAYAVDHAPWQAVLDRYRNNAAEVDYGGVQRNGAVDSYIETLGTVSLPQDASAQAAFWAAFTMHAVGVLLVLGVAPGTQAAVFRRVHNIF